jgi:Pyruvate/2-oxoacid:ferredoxin oxidoreductase delta subunit
VHHFLAQHLCAALVTESEQHVSCKSCLVYCHYTAHKHRNGRPELSDGLLLGCAAF